MPMIPSDLQFRRITSLAEAQVIAELETARCRTVTTRDVAAIIGVPIGSQRARDIVALMRRHGWLRALPLRGAYEFEPAVGGSFPSGDPWIELKVALERNPRARAHVGLGTAAFLRRLADRRPMPDTVVWEVDQPLPPGLRAVYRVVRCSAGRFFGTEVVQGVPVARVERIALEVAMWWQHAGDLRNPEHWLKHVLQRAEADRLAADARRLGPAVSARLGYLASVFGADSIVGALGELPRTGPVWLGPRRAASQRYDARWGVYDTIGVGGSV